MARKTPGLGSLVNHFVPEFEPTEEEKELLDKYGKALSFIRAREGTCSGMTLKRVYFGIQCGPVYGGTYENLMRHFHEFELSAVGLGLVTLDYPGRRDNYRVGLTERGEKLVDYYSKTKSKE